MTFRTFLALALLALPVAATASPPASAAPVPAAADSDTVPVLPEVIWVELGDADPDSVLLSGGGVVLAFEDTFTFDPGAVDTLEVAARRMTIGEVIEAIGRQMEREAARLQGAEYTTLTTIVQRDVPSRHGDDYEVTEVAERTSWDGEHGRRSVRLWERTRTLEDGEVTEEEVEREPERDWGDVSATITMATPFAAGSAGRYNYTVEARELVGNSLIYRVAFAPRNRFEALPSGRVWVDTGHWVIRKIEARFTGAVPFPLFIRAIPLVRVSRERFGGHWFATDAHVVVDLHRIPLLDNPRQVEIRTRLKDIEINGRPVRADMPVPEAERWGTLDPGEFWMTQEASDDSLRAFWSGLDRAWARDESPAAAVPVPLDSAQVDSLTARGRAELTAMRQASPWAWRWLEPRLPGHNRVQGFVPRVGARLWHRGPVRPVVKLMGGYAFASGRPEGRVDVAWPLVRGRVGGGPGVAPRAARLGLDLAGWKQAELFGGDGRRHARALSSFLWGSDPNQYLESRGASARLTWRPARRLALFGEAAYAQEKALEQQTSWNVLGRRLRPDGNAPALGLEDGRAGGGLRWGHGPLAVDGRATWHHARGLFGRTDLRELEAGGRLDLLHPAGHELVVKGRHREFDGAAPVQWRTYLGDHGTLRGYPAGVLAGDEATWASADLRLGWDLPRALGLPVLKHWRIQTLGFVDWGRTRAVDGGVLDGGTGGAAPAGGLAPGATGERWDVGFGFATRLDLPLAWGHPYLRTYVARPVGEGSEGMGWRYLVAFEM